jgi:lipoprotein-anchoring transpeptidase ErfK/SrfK
MSDKQEVSEMISRRKFLLSGAGLASLAVSGCTSSRSALFAELGPQEPTVAPIPAEYRRIYGPMPLEEHPVPAVRLARLDPKYFRRIVPDPTGEKPGTIVVDTSDRYLYLVRDDGQAVRYGVGIGREGFGWSGKGYIARKQEWPVWTPPTEMVAREPELAEYAHGMEPGLENPLGARALYIYADGHDTLYRLHGNPDETSIGKAVSSGCVRLLNQDVIDLYSRVPTGTEIVVV